MSEEKQVLIDVANLKKYFPVKKWKCLLPTGMRIAEQNVMHLICLWNTKKQRVFSLCP